MKNIVSQAVLDIRTTLGFTQAKLAEALGVNVSRIKTLEGGRAENLTQLESMNLVKNLNVSPAWLITGEGKMFNQPSTFFDIEVKNNGQNDFVMVPRYDVSASAGNGSIIQSELIVDHLAFREDWIVSMGLNRKMLALITVAGDSMEPVLRNNDLVLIDMRFQNLRLDGIYAIQNRGNLLIKRIHSRVDGTIMVVSENPRYEPEILTEQNTENFVVVGRAVWYGRAM